MPKSHGSLFQGGMTIPIATFALIQEIYAAIAIAGAIQKLGTAASYPQNH